MLQSFFNGLSGLFGFSRSLDTISNNIANMNTPGFRGNDRFFRSVAGELGTQVSDENVRTTQGDVRQTGNGTDLALNGSGFFMLRDEKGEVSYTRSGQFHFNDDGILVDASGKSRVAGLDSAGNLIDVTISSMRSLPPQATTKISFTGNLSTGDADGHLLSDVRVYNTKGEEIKLSVNFTKDPVTAGKWLVEVKDSAGTVIANSSVSYGPDGKPLAGSNSISVNVSSNGQTQAIQLEFGTPTDVNASSSFSGGTQSTLTAKVVDGHALASVTTVSVTDAGLFRLQYSNGESKDGPQLAVAHFKDETVLQHTSGSQYRARDNAGLTIGRPNKEQFGKVVGGSLEMSNVDLTKEFADMIIIQRGYQASSKVLNVANELIEQLYNSTRTR